ncbi:hypothetical protein GE061_004739 [Apolygus lucorum]|uniref:Uncharacterized protein n=1 Tax=Apolygus lucorum TaxID=248454 RepID=A0A8S9X1Z9_APOLU|nr:hypothetical protein GE061_004739 [Apolygus lucorum]
MDVWMSRLYSTSLIIPPGLNKDPGLKSGRERNDNVTGTTAVDLIFIPSSGSESHICGQEKVSSTRSHIALLAGAFTKTYLKKSNDDAGGATADSHSADGCRRLRHDVVRETLHESDWHVYDDTTRVGRQLTRVPTSDTGIVVE